MNVRSRVEELRPRRVDVVDAVALAAMVMVALYSFQSSYGGVTYLIVGAIALATALVFSHVAGVRRWSVVVVLALGTGVYVLIGTWLALRHYALANVIPTPRSMYEVLASSITGWKELITTAPPVGNTGDLMILPVLLCFVGGTASGLLARHGRFAPFALGAPVIILGLGIATGTNHPVSPVVHGAVLGAGMIGWMAWRSAASRKTIGSSTGGVRRLAAGSLLLAAVGVVGYAAAPVMPGHDGDRRIWRQTVTPPFDPRVYPSPLAGYRDYVKLGYDADGGPNPDELMLTIEGLPEGVPIRLATMDSYDGLVWQVSGGEADDPSLNDSGSFERIGSRLGPEFDGEEAEITVTIEGYSDVWVPDVGEVISIRFEGSEGGPDRDRELAESFRYNRATDTGAVPVRLRKGDRYSMTVRLPEVYDSMASADVIPVVPRLGTTRSVAELTQKLVTPDVLAIDDVGVRLDHVKELLITTGAYSDGDRQANQIAAKAGHSEARLSEFVQDYPTQPFIGNAEQYASAYALLFRDLGNLPTRIVMGFLPRDRPEQGPIQVHQTEVEAWVEVPVEGVGWVAIFPTPPRDQTSNSSTAPQQPDPDYRTQNPPPPPLVDPEFDQPAKASGEAKAADEQTATEPGQPQDDGTPLLDRPGVRYAAFAATPLLVVLLIAALVVGVKVIRRRRRRSRGTPDRRIAAGWREVTDLSTDLGRPVPTTNTRREAAVFLGDSSVQLAQRTDANVWSGRELSDADVDQYWDELEATLHSMKSEVGAGRRLRATVSIQSLKTSASAQRWRQRD